MRTRDFDDLARRMAGGTPRRRLLAGLVGLAAGPLARVRVAAQDASVGHGGACTTTAQCVQAVGCGPTPASVICADNGIAEDGSTSCCVMEGGWCGSDAGCCAGLVCDGEELTECGQGRCRVAGTGGKLPLDACDSTADCSQAGGPARCVRGLIWGSMHILCCRDAGGQCAEDDHCCGTMSCRGGFCADLSAGASRTATDDLILRSRASIDSEALAFVPAGSAVILAEQGRLWEYTSVYWEGLYGWVLTAYLA